MACADNGPSGDLGGKRQRALHERVGRHDLVGETDPQRFVRADLTAGQAQLLGSARADEAGQALRAAATRNDAEQDLRLSEHRLVRRDAVVAGEREFASAAERVPADRGDHEARDRRDGVERIVERRTDRGRLVGPAELRDVGACSEQPIAAGDHDGARRILGQLRRRCADLAEEFVDRALTLPLASVMSATPSACRSSVSSSAMRGVLPIGFGSSHPLRPAGRSAPRGAVA